MATLTTREAKCFAQQKNDFIHLAKPLLITSPAINNEVARYVNLTKGKGFASFNISNAIPTTYCYSLVINNEKVATLKMITK